MKTSKLNPYVCCVFVLLLSMFSASYAEIYKWVDAEGKTHYSEKKEDAPNASAVKVKVTIPTAETQAAIDKKNKPVKTGLSTTSEAPIDDMVKCAISARVMVDSHGKSEWHVNAEKIQEICPGKGFECTTYFREPEKNKCVPFEWDGKGSFFREVNVGFPSNTPRPSIKKPF
jgi:hypothetical protein